MNTKDKIAVMQAWVDGKAIEMRHSCVEKNGEEWMLCRVPDWTWGVVDYRIKSEPREWWIVFDAAGNFFDFSAVEPIERGLKVVKVREVIE